MISRKIRVARKLLNCHTYLATSCSVYLYKIRDGNKQKVRFLSPRKEDFFLRKYQLPPLRKLRHLVLKLDFETFSLDSSLLLLLLLGKTLESNDVGSFGTACKVEKCCHQKTALHQRQEPSWWPDESQSLRPLYRLQIRFEFVLVFNHFLYCGQQNVRKELASLSSVSQRKNVANLNDQ